MKKIITIVGATASGKTSLAIKLASRFDGEIISLDSRQIYRGMKIGTAQPTNEEMKRVKHHLIGIYSPSKTVSAGAYAELVIKKIQAIHSRSKIPIICGGAGLYYRAIKKGIFDGSVSNPSLRKKLEQSYDANPISLMDYLLKIDSEYAKLVHINNKKRLVRALEIYETTGKTPSENFRIQKSNLTNYLDIFTIMLSWNRDKLAKRISQRLDFMLDMGWIKEVEELLEKEKYNSKPFSALDSIGYNQIQSYLAGKINYQQMKKDIIIKTRQFSRRQVQWFKKENIDIIVEMDNLSNKEVEEILCCFLMEIS